MYKEEKYKEYISSSVWKKLRLTFVEGNYNEDLDRSNGDISRRFMCDSCQWNFRKEELEVHHKHYKTFGSESRSDVEILCRSCHAKADKIRRIKVREKNEQALEDARFDGFLRKKHGEYYAFFDELDYVKEYEEFWEWREKVEFM